MGPLQVRARALIVGGWAFVLFGSFAYFLLLVHLGYFSAQESLAWEGTVILPMIANSAALAAWWWLTRLRVNDNQLAMVQKACYAFGLQALLIAGSVLASVSVAETASTTDQLIVAALVCEAVGGLAIFVGFIALAGVYVPRRELPREVPRTVDMPAFDDDDDE